MLISTGVVFAGISIAGVIYGLLGTGPITEKDVLETLAPSIFAVLRDKFYVDELYEATVVRLNAAFARFCHWLDSVLLDWEWKRHLHVRRAIEQSKLPQELAAVEAECVERADLDQVLDCLLM